VVAMPGLQPRVVGIAQLLPQMSTLWIKVEINSNQFFDNFD